MNLQKSFSLNASSAQFLERQKNVFDQLKVIENNRKITSPENETDMEVEENFVGNRRGSRSVTKQFRGKESIFKKPQNPVPKNFWNKIPDFKKNPHKWTKYSLDDVSEEDNTDKANTRAALSFLKELDNRRCTDNNNFDDNAEASSKIVFKKHNISLKRSTDNSEKDKVTFRCSKLVMPEYIVGQKVKKDKKNVKIRSEKGGKELKLDHLLNDEDNE